MAGLIKRLAAALSPAQPAPDGGEIAPINADFWEAANSYLGRMPNPDEVLVHPDIKDSYYRYPYGLFEECLDKDPHLYSVLKQWQMAILSAPRSFKPADETPAAEACRALADYAIKQLPRFEGNLGDMLIGGKYYGIAYEEIMWEYAEGRSDLPAGAPSAPVLPVNLLSRHPRRFLFDTQGKLRLLKGFDLYKGEEVPPDKFIVFAPRKRYENPYGVPLARTVIWPSSFKRQIQNWSMRFAEKFASPTAIGSYDGQKPDATTYASWKRIVTSVTGLSGIIKPKELNIELLEAQRSGTMNVYGQLIDLANNEISKAVLLQTMTTDAPDKGARSLGEVQARTLEWGLRADAFAMAECISTQLIKPLIDFNFPPGKRLYPELAVDTRAFGELAARLARFLDASKIPGLELSKTQIREEANLAEPKDEQDTLKYQPPPSPFGELPGKQGKPEPVDPAMPKDAPPPEEIVPPKPQAASLDVATLDERIERFMLERWGDLPMPKNPSAKLVAPPSVLLASAEKLPGKDLAALYTEGVSETAKLGKQIGPLVQDWVIAQAGRLMIGPEEQIGDPAKLPWDQLELPADLQASLVDRLNDDLTIGALYGREAMHKDRGEKVASTAARATELMAAEGEIDPVNPLAEPLFGAKRIIPKRVLSVFSRKVHAGMTSEQFYMLDALARGASFTAWNLALEDVRHIGGALQDALHNGWTCQQFADYLRDRLDARYVQGDEMHSWHIETIYHTNLATAYNQAALDETWEMREDFPYVQFLNPDPEYPTCKEMAGKVWPVESQVWRAYNPPLHFGCGSSIAAISGAMLDTYGLSVESAPPTGQPEVYAGPGGEGKAAPFGAWAPMEERYQHMKESLA